MNKINIEKKMRELDTDYATISNMAFGIIKDYCVPLDSLIDEFSNRLHSVSDLTNEQLSIMLMHLSTCLYTASVYLEYTSLKDDLATAVRRNTYNREMVNSVGKVVDKQSNAELASNEDTLIAMIVSSAYKQLKTRVDTGNELVQSIKKIISLRMSNYGGNE